jgi:molybdenum cofactor cytidylyltransferase
MADAGRVAAIILAAGTASRYRLSGGTEASKLVAPWHGKPLVRHVAEAALASRARPVIVVTGHARRAVEGALAGLALTVVHNGRYAAGLAGSLQTGIAALPADAIGAVILLGDMPSVTGNIIDALIDAQAAHPHAAAVVPTQTGQRGNPALLGRSLFPAVASLSGDEGARKLIATRDSDVIDVPIASDAILHDIDTTGDLTKID